MSSETKKEETKIFTSAKTNTGNGTGQDRLTGDQWNNIEVIVNGAEKNVIHIMNELGKNDNTEGMTIEHTFNVCGNDYNFSLRNNLIKNGILDEIETEEKESDSKKKKKKSKGKGKGRGKGKSRGLRNISLDEALSDGRTLDDVSTYVKSQGGKLDKAGLKRLTAIQLLNKCYNASVGNINTVHFERNRGLSNSYLECRLITLMFCLHHATKYDIPLIESYELITGVDRLLNALKKIDGVDKQLVNDLCYLNNNLKQYIDYSHRVLCTNYPRLLLSTKYDCVIPSTAVKPYTSQLDIMNIVKKYNNALIMYNVSIGAGKTTTAAALSAHVHKLRAVQKANCKQPTKVLLFVCSIAPVREQVGNLVWNMQIPFAIATYDRGAESAKVTLNWNCARKRNNVEVILADIDSGLDLLKRANKLKLEGKEHEDYLLFFDEPTVGADQPEHQITAAIPQFMIHGPEQIILSSASNPTIEDIPHTVKLYTDRFPEAYIVSVTSNNIKIGCEIVSYDGYTFAPHAGCKNVSELQSILDRIQNVSFISKLYTSPIVYKWYDILSENETIKDKLPNIVEYFDKVKNRNQFMVTQFACKLIQVLINQNDNDLIAELCKPMKKIVVNEIEQHEIPPEKPKSLVWEEKVEEVQYTTEITELDPSKLLTSDAYKYMGGCLYATSDPIQKAKNMYDVLLSRVPKLKQMMKEYNYHEKEYKKQQTALEKRKFDSQKARDTATSLFQNISPPRFPFPDIYQINTIDHIGKYTKIKPSMFDSKSIRQPFTKHDIDLELGAPEWVILLLYAGVGIYIPNTHMLNKDYLDTVLKFAAKGKLAFLITDDSINYGANYPLSHVIIEDDLADNHSINSIIQLLGRGGRVNKSWSAHAHVGMRTLMRLKNYIQGVSESGSSMEAVNIELATNNYTEDVRRKEEMKLAKFNERKIEGKEKIIKLKLAGQVERSTTVITTIGTIRRKTVETKVQTSWRGTRVQESKPDRYSNFQSSDRQQSSGGSWGRGSQRNESSGSSWGRESQRNESSWGRGSQRNESSGGSWGRGSNVTSEKDRMRKRYDDLKKNGSYIPTYLKKMFEI